MPFQSLSTTLSKKPRVLAGPVLRKVTPDSVTVWLALQVGANVTLEVLGADGPFEGERHTVAVGENLHLVAVTATPKETTKPLTEGVVYRYDLTFVYDIPIPLRPVETLASATDNALLAYPPFDEPTFCLPPADVNNLRLIHGSCRIPHGNGVDMLPLVGQLISQTAETPFQRPHQLLLMGDQIYADDVAPSMLVMLTDASDVLLGWKEVLPVPPLWRGLDTADKLSPFIRRGLLDRSGFTSEDLDSHLMALGEYICMYLFVWSDVLWSVATIPSHADVVANVRANLPLTHPPGVPPDDPMSGSKQLTVFSTTESGIKQLTVFYPGLAEVRRILANIPSYMICDDHEVTDDWNMTLDVCLGLYGNALGRRVVKNALVAYSLCQHWGNVPEQFDASNPSLPGTTLLGLLDGGDAARYEANSAKIDAIVSVHTGAEIKARGAVFHGPNSLTYNYAVEGPGHQIIVTDTRTWRSFPLGAGEQPDLLPPQQLVAQIQQIQPATAGRALLVVLSTNAPPVEPIRSATRHDWITNHVQHFPDIRDAWELPQDAFDRLIKSLTDRLPLVSGELRGPAILLSGDVHISFASRLLYKAKKRFEDATNRPATAVVAQLVASSLRKQTNNTLGLHDEGYTFSPHWYVSPLIGPHVTEYYAGWNLSGSAVVLTMSAGFPSPVPLSLNHSGTRRLGDGIALKRAADWIYQLDYLGITKGGAVPNAPKPLPPLRSGATADQRKQALQAFNVATGNYRQYNVDPGGTRQIIGLNNVGEVTFDWPSSAQKKVVHTIRWSDPSRPLPLFVDYAVSLDPKDSDLAYVSKTFAVSP